MGIKEVDPCAKAKKYCAGQKRSKKMDAAQSIIAKAKRQLFSKRKNKNNISPIRVLQKFYRIIS